MPDTLIQILTIIRYEFIMQWRRRAMLVMTLAMLVVAVVPAVLVRNELEVRDALLRDSDTFTSGLVGFTFIPIGAVLAMVMPFVLADTIPKDEQCGVRELINSTSLSPGVYLAGKVLGAWFSVFSSLGIVVIGNGLAWWLIVSSFNLAEYIEPWLVGAVSMTVINIGLIVLLTAGQPDARRAVLVTILFFVVIPGIMGFDSRGDWRDIFNPLRPGIFFYYTDVFSPNAESMAVEATPQGPAIDLLPVGITILTGLAQVALVWGIVWGWLRRK